MSLPPLSPSAALRWDVVRKHVESIAPTSILELGAGQGAVATRLASTASYLGIEPDNSSRSTALARLEVVDGKPEMYGDLGDVDSDRSFDLACAFEVLEHVEDDKGALTEWVARVRPGGHVLLSVPADPGRFGPSDELVGHFRRYTPERLTDVLNAAGLEVVRVERYGFPLMTLLDVARNQIARRRLARGSAPTDVVSRTAGSGRHLQPPTWAGTAIWWATAPFRWSQLAISKTRGPGLVALARRPG